jgi:hypothetical protein
VAKHLSTRSSFFPPTNLIYIQVRNQ